MKARGAFPLTYVCAWCSTTVAQFPDVNTHEPATMSVCDKPECREQASRRYKEGGTA